MELGEHGVGREDQRVRSGIRVELRRLVLHALDRRDVAGPEGELSRDLRVVDEVHERRGGRHAAAGRDEHVVGEEDPALLRDAPLHLRIGEQEDVAGPRHARGEIARCKGLRIVVAVEPADLARILGLLDHGERAIERLVRDLRRIVSVLEHDEPERVAHRVPDPHLALELRVGEELRDARDGLGDLLVPRNPVHSREPGERVLPVRVEPWACLRVDEIREVRDEGLVELLRPALRDVLAERAVVVGRDDDVATDALSLTQTALHGREVLRVRIDVLVVVDLDARLRRELLERRGSLHAGSLERRRRIDVVRPVREVEDVVHLAAGRAAPAASAARREERRQGEQRSSSGAASQEFLSSQPWVHICSSSSVGEPFRSTTNVDSGAQLRTTFVPGAGTRPPASMFCANT